MVVFVIVGDVVLPGSTSFFRNPDPVGKLIIDQDPWKVKRDLDHKHLCKSIISHINKINHSHSHCSSARWRLINFYMRIIISTGSIFIYAVFGEVVTFIVSDPDSGA